MRSWRKRRTVFPRFHGKIFLPIAQRIEFYGKIGKVIEHLTKSLVIFFQPLIKMSSVFNHFPTFHRTHS
ncbi:hypothetical protein LguiA_004616 [Lonicera macranthoides]